MNKARTGTLRQRFPNVTSLRLDLRLEAAISGATLEQVKRTVDPDEPLQLDIACPGGCSAGHFLLTEAVETLLGSPEESRQGMAICQAGSYADPRVPCGTKLFYQIHVEKQ